MTGPEQEKAFDTLVAEMRRTLLSKAQDYANEDRLSNFKLGGEIIGSNAAKQCLALIATKVARLGNLIGTSKIPNNESIDDNAKDLCCYGVLLQMILKEDSFRDLPTEDVDEDLPMACKPNVITLGCGMLIYIGEVLNCKKDFTYISTTSPNKAIKKGTRVWVRGYNDKDFCIGTTPEDDYDTEMIIDRDYAFFDQYFE